MDLLLEEFHVFNVDCVAWKLCIVLKFMYSMLPSGCMGFRSIDHLCMLRMCSKHVIIVVLCCIQLHIVNYNEWLSNPTKLYGGCLC